MAVTVPPALIVLTPGGLALALRLAEGLPDAEIHGLAARVPEAAICFDSVATHLRALFAAGRPIVGVCAAGVLIRALAPALADKRTEPPVVAVAEDGGAVVPLLGGHRGGNALARRIADHLGIAAAITTAGDARFGVALDDPPAGWRLADARPVKRFTASLLGGATVRLEGEAGWLGDSGLPFDAHGALTIAVTDRAAASTAERLVYHPARLAVGVGCERDAEPAELVDLVRRTLDDHGLAAGAVAAVVSIDLKADEPAVHAAAAALGVPARFFDAAALEAETPRLANPSDRVFRAVGCHGVAEGAALAAVGPSGDLVAPKTKSRRATCAVSRAPEILDACALGRPRGSLAIVGIGPGAAVWRTPEANAALAAATDLVGYDRYLDLLGPVAGDATRHPYALGEEEARCGAALDLAAAGRVVALVSSGDPGIYAMAALVFELLDREGRADWHRAAVTVVPGISALQAAAARVGAPLGHDFCAISLSDLLTPWSAIERRLRAAAEADFVVSLYNPVSRRRNRQLGAARDILAGHRPPDTPVVLARNLGRDGERVEVVRLADLTADRVDMLTVVLVGASDSRVVARPGGGRWVYTPRGYAAKRDDAEDAAQ
ncbi:MAG: precorrin-3B C(17)-methyltransferase [Alphaproteobacteria bacterium]